MSNEQFQQEIDALREKLKELIGEERTYFICATEWDHELPEKHTRFFKTLDDLKNNSPCWEDCGVYKVTCRADLAAIPKEMTLASDE